MIQTKNKLLRTLLGIGLTGLLPCAVQATLLVEQWTGLNAGSGGLAQADAVIAANAATYSGFYSIIDFTDDPAGFAGLIPGSSPWPAAFQAGVSGTGHPLNDNFAARITTILNITVADTYGFRTYADDGLRLKIGGVNVIYDDSYHPEQQRTGSIFLSPGAHALELVFFEGGGEASLEFSVRQGLGQYVHIPDLVGVSTTAPVPDVASTLSLLGLALVVMGTMRRKG